MHKQKFGPNDGYLLKAGSEVVLYLNTSDILTMQPSMELIY
jgi:hypothetical protein